MAHPTPSPTSSSASTVTRGALGLLAFLLLVAIINFVDRNLIAAFGPSIVVELGLDHTQFGIVTGVAFTSLYAIMALVAGLMADRINRTWVLAGGLLVWSVFTAVSGLATGFLFLLLVRPLVAAGEASLIPTATALLTTRFPASHHATVMGIFFMGIPLGIGGSYLISATLGPAVGWRNSFFILGGIGVLLALLALLIKSAPAAGPATPASPALPLKQVLSACLQIFKTNRNVRLGALALIAMHAHLASLPFVQLWLVQDKGLSPEQAGKLFGGMLVVVGTLGSLGAGSLGDWCQRRWGVRPARFLAGFVALLVPLILAFRLMPADSLWFKLGMAASVLFFSGFYGPAFAIFQREIPDQLKSTLTGLLMLVIQIFVLGLGAALIGLVSDYLHSIQAISTLTGPVLVGDIIGLSSLLLLYAIDRKKKPELTHASV